MFGSVVLLNFNSLLLSNTQRTVYIEYIYICSRSEKKVKSHWVLRLNVSCFSPPVKVKGSVSPVTNSEVFNFDVHLLV